MAEDARTPPARTSRKTLDDIRREIDAEFEPPVDTAPSDDHERAAYEAFRESPSPPGGRGYLKVALLATVVVSVFVLGYLIGQRHGDDRVASAPSAATRDPVVTEAEPPPSSSLIANEPASVIRDVPDDVAAENVPPDSSHRDVAVARAATEPEGVAPTRNPAVVKPPAPARAEKAPAPVAMIVRDPGDWVESQRQLRTALREWLVRSDSGTASVNPDDAEVMLGADGYTAKTRVRVRVGAQAIMREQQWRRMPGGWMIVEERQADVPRP